MSKRTKKTRPSPKQPSSQQKSPSPVSRAAEGETQATPSPVPERPLAAPANPSVAPVSGAGISVPPGSAYQSVRPPTDEIDDAWGDAGEPAPAPSARLIDTSVARTSRPPASTPKSAPPESKRSQRTPPVSSPGGSGPASTKVRPVAAQPATRAVVPPAGEPHPAAAEPKSAPQPQARASTSRASKAPPVSTPLPTNEPPLAAPVQATGEPHVSEVTGAVREDASASGAAPAAADDKTSQPSAIAAGEDAPGPSPLAARVSDELTPAQPQFAADGPPPAAANTTRAWLWVATVLVAVGVGWYLKPAPPLRDCDCRADVQKALLAATAEAATAPSTITDAATASAATDAPVPTAESATPPASSNDLADAAAPSANGEYPVIVQTEAKERVDVLVKSQPATVRILRRGKELGKTPVIIQIGRGERRVFEVNAPGYGLRRLVLGSDKPEVLVALKPLAGGVPAQ